MTAVPPECLALVCHLSSPSGADSKSPGTSVSGATFPYLNLQEHSSNTEKTTATLLTPKGQQAPHWRSQHVGDDCRLLQLLIMAQALKRMGNVLNAKVQRAA